MTFVRPKTKEGLVNQIEKKKLDLVRDLVSIEKFTEAEVKVHSFDEILKEISNEFRYKLPGFHKFKKSKASRWDGIIRLFSLVDHTFPTGLVPKLITFIKSKGYRLKIDDTIAPTMVRKGLSPEEYFSEQDGIDLFESLQLDPNRFQLKPRQIFAIVSAIRFERCILISATSSGKSMIIYLILRHFVKKLKFRKMCAIVIVPTAALVEQMYADFETYSQNIDPEIFSPERDIHRIHSGMEKIKSVIVKSTEKPIVISTWQSLNNIEDLDYFSSFRVVIGDEAHGFKANCLMNIMMEKLIHARVRIGTTGTLDDEKVHRMMLEGIFGPLRKVITAREMIDAGDSSSLKIHCLHFVYNKEERKENERIRNKNIKEDSKGGGKKSYEDEIKFLCQHKQRNQFLLKKVFQTPGNSLVIFRLVESHGKKLYNKFLKKYGHERHVFFVDQKATVEEREEVRAFTEKHEGVVIFASERLFSQGTSINNLQNVFNASPNASKIMTLQKIGRILRKDGKGNEATSWDIADDLRTRMYDNYAFKHFDKRLNMYESEGHPYEIETINFD